MSRRTRSRLLPLSVLLAAPCLAVTARAELPEPADFRVQYFVTDETGDLVRPMSEDDRQLLLNRARCQCGHQVGVTVQTTSPPADATQRLQALVGTQCAIAETEPEGQFRPCGQLTSALVSGFAAGFPAIFHPAFLAVGINPISPSRDIADPATRIINPCNSAFEGKSGLWMCAPDENGVAACQADEFFLGPVDTPALSFDFMPPLLAVSDLSVEPGDGSAVVRWEVPVSGDIHGFRVLCEEASSQASPGHDFPAPALGERADHYFTAGNLCGDQPFFDQPFLTGEPGPSTCGNGVVEPGEACDDGSDNSSEGLCDPSCDLRVGPALHALAWDHVCSDHIPFTEDSVVVDGLTGGVAYNFVLVSYDLHGNPRVFARVVTATPGGSAADSNGPELEPGPHLGCGCTTSPEGHGLFTMSLATLGLFALRRRR